MILFGYYCGFRIQDAAPLLWPQVDVERRVVSLRPGKERRDQKKHNGETVMLPELRQWLLDHLSVGKTPLLPSLHGKKSGGKYGLSPTFRELLKSAAVTFKDVSSDGAKRRFFDLAFIRSDTPISASLPTLVYPRKYVGNTWGTPVTFTDLPAGYPVEAIPSGCYRMAAPSATRPSISHSLNRSANSCFAQPCAGPLARPSLRHPAPVAGTSSRTERAASRSIQSSNCMRLWANATVAIG